MKKWLKIVLGIVSVLVVAFIGLFIYAYVQVSKEDEAASTEVTDEETTTEEATDSEVPDGMIDVNTTIDEEINDNKVVVSGTTNLPTGTKLKVNLSVTGEDDNGIEKEVTVNDKGKYKSEEFSNNGSRLKGGNYSIYVSMVPAAQQSEEVQKLIGDKGQNLTGNQVAASEDNGNLTSTNKFVDLTENDAEKKESQGKLDQDTMLAVLSESTREVFGDKNDFNKKDAVDKVELVNDTAFIRVYGKDNVSNKLIKSGMYMDITDVLKKIEYSDDLPSKVAFDIIFPLQDKLGNTKDEPVMRVVISSDTIHKINFKNFNYDNIPDIAESYWEHDAIK